MNKLTTLELIERDLLSHHYTDIQADIVFEICKEEIDDLDKKMKQLKELL